MNIELDTVNLCSNPICKIPLSKLNRCSKCLSVTYCNKLCQKLHWGEHKSVCKKLYALRNSGIKTNSKKGHIKIPADIIKKAYTEICDTDNKKLALFWDSINNKYSTINNDLYEFKWKSIIYNTDGDILRAMDRSKRIIVIKRRYKKNIHYSVKIFSIYCRNGISYFKS